MSTKSIKRQGFESVQEYCDESSIHGFQFVAPSRHCGQRLIWIVLIVCAFTFAGIVVKSLLDNWDNSPTVTTIATTEYSVQKFPFPAVTVCPNGYDQWGYLERFCFKVDIINDPAKLLSR